MRPHPLFAAFVRAAVEKKEGAAAPKEQAARKAAGTPK